MTWRDVLNRLCEMDAGPQSHWLDDPVLVQRWRKVDGEDEFFLVPGEAPVFATRDDSAGFKNLIVTVRRP